jgi:hypothetical protein
VCAAESAAQPGLQRLCSPQMPVYSRAIAHWPRLPQRTGEAPATAAEADDNDDDAHGYGSFLSVGTDLPMMFGPAMPFHDRFQMQADMLDIRNMVHMISITRDRGRGGRVSINRKVRTRPAAAPLATCRLPRCYTPPWASHAAARLQIVRSQRVPCPPALCTWLQHAGIAYVPEHAERGVPELQGSSFGLSCLQLT